MKQNYFLKLAFFILLSLISSFNLKAQLNTGDIALIAYNADGGDDFAMMMVTMMDLMMMRVMMKRMPMIMLIMVTVVMIMV